MFKFKKLTQNKAMIIADEWYYDDLYSCYNLKDRKEDYAEFTNEDIRNLSDYFEAELNDCFVGFFAVTKMDKILELSLGLKPSMCSKKLGTIFINDIIAYIKENYNYEVLFVCVESFNERALKVYRKCGFKYYDKTVDENGCEILFLIYQ